jgi:hypothetical protein
MICDLADMAISNDNEDEKHSEILAPTPSAAHNPYTTTTSDGGEFQATKMSEDVENVTMSTKMSKMAENATTASNFDKVTNLKGSSTSSIEKVAVAEIAVKCVEMST